MVVVVAPEVLDAAVEFPVFTGLDVVPVYELEPVEAVPLDVVVVVEAWDPNPFELVLLPLEPEPMNWGTTEIVAVATLLLSPPSDAKNRNVSMPWKLTSGV